MSSDMMDVAKKIALIRHVGVKKTKLISSPLKINGDKIDSEDPNTEANSEVSTEANSEVSTEEKVVNVPKEELNKEEDI
jgi:small subunit ribosomal protein S3Ae